MKPLLLSLLVMLCVSGVVYAQTRPLGLPQFSNPPETNGADPVLYPNGVLYNTGLACSQRSNGATWLCLASQSDVAAANAAQDTSIAATYAPTTTVNSLVATMQGAINSNTSTIGALSTRVTAAESAITALQALPKRLCTSFTVAAGVSVPLTGISTVQNVALAGVPAGAVCDTGAPSRMPLGARPDPVVTTAGTVAMAFVSNAGLLSSVISIPSGTYKVCCDSF